MAASYQKGSRQEEESEEGEENDLQADGRT